MLLIQLNGWNKVAVKEFGKRLAQIIDKKGLKQNEFCSAIGYSPQKLSNVITGKTLAPRIDLLYAIAKKYSDVDIRWLLIGDYQKKDTDTPITRTQYEDLINDIKELKSRVRNLEDED